MTKKENNLGDLFQKVTGTDSVTEKQEEQTTRVPDSDDPEEVRGLPTTEATCELCEHDRAYYYLRQTRSADESETRFFICTKCDHTWRDYD